MSIQEIQREMTQIKDVLSALQVAVERLSIKLEGADEANTINPPTRHDTINWLALEGLGAELWRTIDTDSYINQERDSWS